MYRIEFDRVTKSLDPHFGIGRIGDRFLRLVGKGEPRRLIQAVDDVSLRVSDGESLGLIGPNCSGKSTTLKLAARILHPTAGTIKTRGRVASLIEIGAGFHPDLTGRENVFLNGAILGMKRAEIKKRLERIIAFAELEGFEDTPVKRYSLGMYMRLGFAIAAHVDSEVLLLDEVLAVGDLGFRMKCFERVRRLKSGGMTILFVSHDMEAVRSVCDRAVLLGHGRIRAQGDVGEVIDTHLEHALRTNKADDEEQEEFGLGPVRVTGLRVMDEGGRPTRTFESLDGLRIAVGWRTLEPLSRPVVGVEIHRAGGQHLFGTRTSWGRMQLADFDGSGEVELHIPSIPLSGGLYTVSAGIWKRDQHHALVSTPPMRGFQVISAGKDRGMLQIDHQWRDLRGEEGADSSIAGRRDGNQ